MRGLKTFSFHLFMSETICFHCGIKLSLGFGWITLIQISERVHSCLDRIDSGLLDVLAVSGR